MRLTRERERMRAEMHRSAVRRVAPTLPVFDHIPVDRLNEFVSAVRQFDTEPVLRYSHRLMLLGTAKQLGIRRFDANLIIASMERERVMSAPIPTGKRQTILAWCIVGAVQGSIIGAAWWAFTL